jgi:hypothetical protein
MSLRLFLCGRQSSFLVLRSTPSRTISTFLYPSHLTSSLSKSSTSPPRTTSKKISSRRSKECLIGFFSLQSITLRDSIATSVENCWLILKILLSTCNLSSLKRTTRLALSCVTHLRRQDFVITFIWRECRI